jgi:hypothetical protein
MLAPALSPHPVRAAAAAKPLHGVRTDTVRAAKLDEPPGQVQKESEAARADVIDRFERPIDGNHVLFNMLTAPTRGANSCTWSNWLPDCAPHRRRVEAPLEQVQAAMALLQLRLDWRRNSQDQNLTREYRDRATSYQDALISISTIPTRLTTNGIGTLSSSLELDVERQVTWAAHRENGRRRGAYGQATAVDTAHGAGCP